MLSIQTVRPTSLLPHCSQQKGKTGSCSELFSMALSFLSIRVDTKFLNPSKVSRRQPPFILSWYCWVVGQSERVVQSAPSCPGGSWHAWTGGHCAWTSCRTAGSRSASHQCVCAGAAAAHPSAWSFCHKRASCRQRGARLRASAGAPSGGTSSCRPCRILVCGRCAVSFCQIPGRCCWSQRSGSWDICSGGSGEWSSAGFWMFLAAGRQFGAGVPGPAACSGRSGGQRMCHCSEASSTTAGRHLQGLQLDEEAGLN